VNVRSISFRLVVWYAGLLAVIFVLLGTLLFFNLWRFLENDLRQSEIRRAHRVADLVLAHANPDDPAAIATQTKEWFEPEMNDRFIRVTRANGTVVYLSGTPKDGSFDPAEVPNYPPSRETEFSRKVQLPTGRHLLIAGLHFRSGPAAYLVEFGEPLDPIETMLYHLFLQLALGLPLAVVIVAAGGYWLVRRALTPVERITRAAEQITQLNLSERLPVTQSGDELERLSVSLNRMIARLDDAFQNSKRFVADASHDLRTPLTILRGELEGMVEDPELDGDLRGRLAGLLEEAIHLSKIVEQLFTLTKLDSGEARKDWARFDLAELARITADQLSLLAEDKKIVLTCEASQPAYVQGDRSRIKQVIVNLLDNAIKYTPPLGRVQMEVHGLNGRAVLEVEDSGVGIAPEALPHVFERFYRVDKARCADAESAGLGLAIVKAICAAHGAEVEAASTPGVGSRFRVKLPLQKGENLSSNHDLKKFNAVIF
jgi:heavy metal sensor kinase